MRKIRISLIVILVLLALTNVVSVSASDSGNFVAELSGANEVPPRDTQASGLAQFRLSQDGSVLGYRLSVARIMNVVAAHIHCGAPGVNGPVGVTLFMGTAGSGRVSGVIAGGNITAPDTGNSCGWVTLDDVVNAILTGNTYVNVHTNDGVDPTNTGPGDFPGGEIRGQIVVADRTR